MRNKTLPCFMIFTSVRICFYFHHLYITVLGPRPKIKNDYLTAKTFFFLMAFGRDPYSQIYCPNFD